MMVVSVFSSVSLTQICKKHASQFTVGSTSWTIVYLSLQREYFLPLSLPFTVKKQVCSTNSRKSDYSLPNRQVRCWGKNGKQLRFSAAKNSEKSALFFGFVLFQHCPPSNTISKNFRGIQANYAYGFFFLLFEFIKILVFNLFTKPSVI